MIDYNLVRLVHRVNGILMDSERMRRLREVSSCPYQGQDKRCKALAAVLQKKAGMSQTELDVLRDFPAEGMNMGYVSNALIFADCFRWMPIAKHKAIVSLLKQDALAILEGTNTDTGRTQQILVRV